MVSEQGVVLGNRGFVGRTERAPVVVVVRPLRRLVAAETRDSRFEMRVPRGEQLLVCLERGEVLQRNSLGTVG